MPPVDLLQSAVILLLVIVAAICLSANKRSKRRNVPPSPMKFPIIGNLHQLSSHPHHSLAALSHKHGPVMLLHLGSVPHLVVSSWDAAMEVLKTKDHIFCDRPSLAVVKTLFYGCKDVAFSNYGDYWSQVRKMSVVHLLSPQRVQSYCQVREEEVASMISEISRSAEEEQPQVINLSEVLGSFSKEVASRVVMGKSTRDKKMWIGKVNLMLEEYNNLMSSFHFADYIPWLSWLSSITGLDSKAKKAFGELDEILSHIINEYRCDQNLTTSSTIGKSDSGESRGSFIDILLSMQKRKDNELGLHLEDDSIKAIFAEMFGAGVDGTCIPLEWVMAELVRNPRTMKKLQNEVRGVSKTSEGILKEEDLIEMKYLRAVINETFRLRPSAPLLLPHQAMETTYIGGYEILKGTRIVINAWAIARDPTYWEDPEEFKPERFLTTSPTDQSQGHDFPFIPFGIGRRSCAGKRFALSVIELALANLVRSFDWELPKGMSREDMDMEEASTLAVKKRVPLHLVAKPYN